MVAAIGGATAQVLLNLITLVQAGFEFQAIANKIKVMVAEGQTDEQISVYLHNLRVATLAEGDAFFKKA
jgi:hypothetical protein